MMTALLWICKYRSFCREYKTIFSENIGFNSIYFPILAIHTWMVGFKLLLCSCENIHDILINLTDESLYFDICKKS